MAVFSLPVHTPWPGKALAGTGQNHATEDANSKLKTRPTMGPGWGPQLVCMVWYGRHSLTYCQMSILKRKKKNHFLLATMFL